MADHQCKLFAAATTAGAAIRLQPAPACKPFECEFERLALRSCIAAQRPGELSAMKSFRVFDPELTLKQQLQRALIGAVFLIVAIFLIVLLGSGLGTITASRNTIVARLNEQTRNEVAKVSGAIADVLSQRLNTVAASVVQTLHSQALTFMRDTPTPLKAVASWPEFEFNSGCAAAAKCPADTAARNLANNTFNAFASLSSSSVYAMINPAPGIIPVQGAPFTLLSEFNRMQDATLSPVPSYVNSKLALLDRVFPHVYSQGPSKDAMFFLYSAASMPDPANYIQRLSMLRQYPGMKRQVEDATQVYDPSERSWFKSAPTSGVGLRVYQETFTKQLVINLATKTTFYPSVTSSPALPCPPPDILPSGSTTEFAPYAASPGVCSSFRRFYGSAHSLRPPNCCESACSDGVSYSYYMDVPAAAGTLGSPPLAGVRPHTCTSQENQAFLEKGRVTLVHAAVLALSEVAAILSKIDIQANRFIVICNQKTQEVIIFNGTAGRYDEVQAVFQTLGSYFPNNGDTSKWFNEQSFSATYQGDEYFVAVNSTFNKLLTVFVFGRSSDIFASYPIFDLRARETSGKVAAIVLAGIVASIVLSSVFIAITVTSINNVLAILTDVSSRIVKISTEAVRDYSECIRSCNLDSARWYTYPPLEFKNLLFNFRDVIKRLAFFETAKKTREAKFQRNPLYKLARLLVNTNEPEPVKAGTRFKLNSSVVGHKGIKVRKNNNTESDVIGYINDFEVVYVIEANTAPLAKLDPASCKHIRATHALTLNAAVASGGGDAEAAQVKIEHLAGESVPSSPSPPTPIDASVEHAGLCGWVSMSLDGDAAFIECDAKPALSKPVVAGNEDLLKTPDSCVAKDLVVEYVQANLLLDGQNQKPSAVHTITSAASVDNVTINILEEGDPAGDESRSVNPWNLTVRLHLLVTFPVFLCLAALSVGMLVVLSSDSVDWFPETKSIMVQFTQSNILTTAYLRSLFVLAFYDQVAMSMSVTSLLDAGVLSGASLEANWMDSVVARNPMWAQNVATNPPNSPPGNPNAFAYPFGPTSVTGGYYWSGRTDHEVVRNLATNRLAAVLDYYHKGAFNPGSRLIWIQFGFSDIALSRRYPYNYASYDNPRGSSDEPVCLAETFPDGSKVSAMCPQCPAPQSVMPAYDARCRTWFGYGRDRATTQKAFFLSPRIGAVTGSDVITGVIQVPYSPQNVILNFNFSPKVLVDAINNEKILSSGYFFIIDCEHVTTNDALYIVHPGSSNCQDTQVSGNSVLNSLKCAESNMCCGKVGGGYQGADFSSSEWAIFKSNLAKGCLVGKSSFSYNKGGGQHFASMSTLALSLQTFAVVAVVPYEAIIEGPESIAGAIRQTVLGIIIGLSVFSAISLLFGIYKMRYLVGKINESVIHLSDLCLRLKADDLSVEVVENASSVDMRNVLSAFSRMIISLRFGSDTYVLGNLTKAQSVFQDALDLFKSVNNSRGIAIANNNLGTVMLKSGQFEPAKRHLNEAIEQSRQDLQAALAAAALAPDPMGNMHPDVKRAHKTLGDRLGNLALCLQKMRHADEHKIILQECLQHNEECGNISGFIIQQVNLVDAYLAEGNIQLAVACVGKIQSQVKEVEVFEQLPLQQQHASLQRLRLCQALIAFHLHQNIEALKLAVESLTAHDTCDLSVTKRGIQLLGELFLALHRSDLVEAIVTPVQAAVFPSSPTVDTASKSSVPKDVLFVLDYSGSMAGSRIKASTENIMMVFNKYISDDDRVMLNHFNTKVYTDIPLSKKRDVSGRFIEALNQLTKPNGGTAFYDAVYGAAETLKDSRAKSYVIGLTDGEDNSSSKKPDHCAQLLKQNNVSGMIVISVEGEGDPSGFETISKATKEGVVLTTSEGADGIAKAFSEVAKLISGDVVLVRD